MTRNTSTTTSSTAASNSQRIINDIAPHDDHKTAAEAILNRLENTNYVQNNPVKSALAALVIAGENDVTPIVTPEHLSEYDVRTDELREAELTLREGSNNQITTDTPIDTTEPLTTTADNDDKIERVHSHIERLGTDLAATVATINKAHNLAKVTQPRNHNAELIAGAALYLAGHYTGNDYFSQTTVGEVMDVSTGELGRISAHLAGFEYWSRKCVDDERNVNSLPVVQYITEYCNELGVRNATREFAVDLIVDFEVIDGRWHLPQNVGIPAIQTAVEVMGTTQNTPTHEIYPTRPTTLAVQDRVETYLNELGRTQATRACAKYAIEEITDDDAIETAATECIDTQMNDVLITDMSALEAAEFAIEHATGDRDCDQA